MTATFRTRSPGRIAAAGVVAVGGQLLALLTGPSVVVGVVTRPVTPAFAQTAADEQVLAQAPLRSTSRYRVNGNALLVRRTDGSLLLRLHDLDMDDGPALRVHLVPGRDQRSPAGGLDLGPLKGTQGTHDYPLPAGSSVDLQGGTTALVYCHKFHVAFGNATLTTG
jgi:hypothetical protein